METILQEHHAKVESFDLRLLLVWVSRNVEGVDGAMICDTETWDKAGAKLSDAAMRSDPLAKDLLGPRRSIYPFDTRLASPRKEPDLQPPDPHNVWHMICSIYDIYDM